MSLIIKALGLNVFAPIILHDCVKGYYGVMIIILLLSVSLMKPTDFSLFICVLGSGFLYQKSQEDGARFHRELLPDKTYQLSSSPCGP